MAISFQCQCGKKMSAKEEFAGRRLRCPDCQRVVTIPRPGSAPVIAPAGSPPSGNTLTAAEMASLRRDLGDTLVPARPKTLASDEMANFFNDAPLPAATTSPPRQSVPADTTPLPPAPPAYTGPHPWIDLSMMQGATSWQPGDEERYQADVAPAREREFPMGWLGAAVIFGGLTALAMLS